MEKASVCIFKFCFGWIEKEKISVNTCKAREDQRQSAGLWKYFRGTGKSLGHFQDTENSQGILEILC